MISRTRAWSLINNPNAQSDDVVMSVVFDGVKPIGYTAIFPEQLQKPINENNLCYWGTTQWIEPEYRGRGISGNMMMAIKDSVNHNYWGLASSISSIKLDQKQGSNVIFYPRYFFQWKIQSKSFIAKGKELLVRFKNKQLAKQIEKFSYTNQYIPIIDDESYVFISEHSSNDLFLRSHETLNWILQYPFLSEIGDDMHIEEQCAFSTNVHKFKIKAVQVYVDNKLSGIYIYSIVDNTYKVLYIYYLEEMKENVFSSVLNGALSSNVAKFCTFNSELFNFANSIGVKNINSKFTSEPISLTLPPNIIIDQSLSIQGGDGDMFC